MTTPSSRRPFWRVDTRRVSKPRLSRIALILTCAIISFTLMVWLLVWINPNRRGISGRWLALHGLNRPWIGPQVLDTERISGAVKGTLNESEYGSFRDVIGGHLEKAGNRPVVLYLSAAGIFDDQGAVLLDDGPGLVSDEAEGSTRHTAITLEAFFDLFKNSAARYPAQTRFLIWDAGQVGSDRGLGVYANGFLASLRAYLKEHPIERLVILGSCAPGQTSASSEADDRSVFGYFVEQALSGKAIPPNALTVQSLSRYVRSQVSLWTRNHRQADQTPELYGEVELDFPIPRTRRAPIPVLSESAAKAEMEEVERVKKRIEKAWLDRDTWQERKAYRLAPRTWTRYLETLLRAEQLFRYGDLNESEQVLNRLPNLATELGRIPPLRGSLALLDKSARLYGNKTLESEVVAAKKNLSEALDSLLGEVVTTTEKDADQKEGEKGEDSGETKEQAEGPVKKATRSESVKSNTAIAANTSDPTPSNVPTAKATETPISKGASGSSGTSRLTRFSRRKSDSPFTRISEPGDEYRPIYPEAQLLVWADRFATRGPDPDAFHGIRGEALEKSVQTRELAELAASADERISHWIRAWVVAGDRSRRKGQDLLFAAETALPHAMDSLDLADEAYEVAIKNAEICEQAIDLVERLSCELPYYGEWKARRGLRLEPGLDQPFQDLLDTTAELARLIHATPAPEGGEENPLGRRDEQVQRIKRQLGIVAESYRLLVDDFRNQWEGGRWHELDAVLTVPFIPAEPRMKLLARIASRSVSSSLNPAVDGADAPAPSTEQPSRIQKEREAFLADRAARASSSLETYSEETAAAADPSFWRTASGLARLEIGMLEIGGVRKEDIASLKEAYDRASRKLALSPFAEFAEFSERVRTIRRTRLSAMRERPDSEEILTTYAANDRMTRVLPLADAVGQDRAADDWIRALRRNVLSWQSERLLEDFSAREAVVLLEKAGDDYGDSEELRSALEKAKVMARAKLVVDASTPGEATFDHDEGLRVLIKVGTEGTVPAGDAVAFLSHEQRAPIAITEKSADPSNPLGTLIPIGTSKPADPIEYLVERTDSTPETVALNLEPGAFYRGQVFPKDLEASSLVYRLTPSKEGIEVNLRQSDRRAVRVYGDQFERHPGQGFLHPHTPLAYRFAIKHTFTKPTKIWLHFGLEGIEDSNVTKPDVMLEPGRVNEEVVGRVEADAHEIPVDKPRFLTLLIRRDNEAGRVLFKRRYPFRQVLPAQYIRVQDGFDETQNKAYVNVWHLTSDPVNGPSDVTVQLDGQSIRTILDRGQAEQWWRVYPKAPPPVPWRIQVEQVIDAFKGKVETGVAPPEGAAPGAPAQ